MTDPTRMGRDEDQPWLDSIQVGRRGVVAGGGVLLTAAALQSSLTGRAVLEALSDAALVNSTFGRIRVERIRRDGDLLAANLVLVDLELRQLRGEYFLTPRARTTGYIGLVLPGQSMGEGFFEEAQHEPPLSVGDPDPRQGKALYGAELALPSVLAFEVPTGRRVDYEVSALLNWTGLAARWAAANGKLPSRIEAPYRLELRPVGTEVWQHSGSPVRLSQGPKLVTAELWHTRLTAIGADNLPEPREASMRVEVPKTLITGLKTPLTAENRATIRRQTLPGSSVYAPVQADRLILTSLGATMELHGSWPKAPLLLSWDHRTTLGRDHYVKVVTKGHLAPWGHPAACIRETFRWMTQVGGNAVAYLVTRTTVLLQEPVVDTSVAFDRANGTQGARIPFTQVRCSITQTPPLKADDTFATNGGVVAALDGTRLQIPFVGTDWTGRQVPFSSLARFVSAKAGAPQLAWNSDPLAERAVDLGGQQVAVSTEDPKAVGGMTLPVGVLQVEVVDITAPVPADQSNRATFRPVVTSFMAEVPAMTALAGGQPIKHEYHASFVANAAHPRGIVLGRVEQAGAALQQIEGAVTGGFMKTPAYQGLCKAEGAIMAADLSALDTLGGVAGAGSTANPENIFEGITLLGGIELTDIVDIDNETIGIPKSVPTVRTVGADGRQTVTMTITPQLKELRAAGIVFLPDDGRGRDGKLSIVAVTAAGGTTPAEASVDARLTDVRLQLADLVVLPINEFRLTSSTAVPFDVVFDSGDLEFLGPLGFVNTLSDIASFLGVARSAARGTAVARLEPPAVDVTKDGISLTQGLAIPDAQVGVFTLTGLAFSFGVRLPFSGALAIDLGFASHERPFQVTYGPFGGGGHVALQLTGGDVRYLEVGLHIAGAIGVNLGVAVGSISVAAGFTLCLPSGGDLSVTAFFRASGSLNVLGLASVSVVFEIALTFVDSEPTLLTGKATLELKIEVLMVSKTVTASVTRSFAGGAKGGALRRAGSQRAAGSDDDLGAAGRPSFRTTYPSAEPWSAYCGSFAGDEVISR